MKCIRSFAFPAIAVILVFAFCGSSLSSDRVLVKLGKKPGLGALPFVGSDLRLIQELETCWIAETSTERVLDFKDKGIPCLEIDTNPFGKTYYLVLLRGNDDLNTLEKFGKLARIEDRIYLFWSEKLGIRGMLPSRFRIKRLPQEATRPRPPERRFLLESEWPHPQQFNADISRMVRQVSAQSLSSSIQRLQDFQTRYSSTAQCEAAGTYLYDYFTSQGMRTEYDVFSFDGSFYSRNIIAVLPGVISPEREVIICGHYDSYSDQPSTLAPGADDNASATAAVMELARVMKDHRFNFTLKFICFSAEEWGLLGSFHYASEAKNNRNKIIAVLNMDMIAYVDRSPEDLDLIVNPDSEWLANKFIASANIYAPVPLLKIINSSYVWSDHSSFWDTGTSALCGIEDADPTNPYYHLTTDTLSTLDMSFCIDGARAALATAADLAQPISIPPAPSGLRAQSQLSSSLFLTVKTVYLNWNASLGGIKGYNIYRSLVSHGDCQKLNSALLSQPSYTDSFLEPDLHYYYVVTSVDEMDRESNNSEEVRDDENNS